MDLNQLVTQVLDLTRARWRPFRSSAASSSTCTSSWPSALPAITGIASEIREAMTNLVFNAVDAMPEGGTLTLRTAAGSRGQVISKLPTRAWAWMKTSRRCLEPFFTTKGERGTGLGLAMVYGTLQRHGGDIQIISAPGAGTTVRLSFVASGTSTRRRPRSAAPVVFGLNILLVDDDPILLNSLRETLELDGHHILTANGGQPGIDTFRDSLQPGTGHTHRDHRSRHAACRRPQRRQRGEAGFAAHAGDHADGLGRTIARRRTSAGPCEPRARKTAATARPAAGARGSGCTEYHHLKAILLRSRQILPWEGAESMG